MSDGGNHESLILRERADLESAPFLFSEDDLLKVDKAKPKFHCTGERLFRDRPDVYKAVVKLLAEPGVSIRTICGECHVSDHTIRSVAAREGISIAAAKNEVLANIRHGLRLATERVIETIPQASTRDALIGVGILAEKMELLSGAPTLRVEIGQPMSIPEQLANLLKEATDKMKAAKASQIINAPTNTEGNTQTDLNGKSTEQKALMNDLDKHVCDAASSTRNTIIDVEAVVVAAGPESEDGGAI